MKITTWNVNQFCGNDEWTIINELKTRNYIKERIWDEIVKEPLLNKIESFLKDENDLLFLNEVPIKDRNSTNKISNEFRNWCDQKGIVIIESQKRESEHFKTIALFKKDSGYDYAFNNYDEKMEEIFNTSDAIRVVALKNKANAIFIGCHFQSNTKYMKEFYEKTEKLVNEIKKIYGENSKIVCCGDTNIYNNNKNILENFLNEVKLKDAWIKENKYRYDDEKGMTRKYEYKKCIYKNRVDRILISESFMCDYKFYVDGKWVDEKDYDSEHNNFIIDSSIGFEYSDHYPISIET